MGGKSRVDTECTRLVFDRSRFGQRTQRRWCVRSYATVRDVRRVYIGIRCVSLERVKLDLSRIVGALVARAPETRIPPRIACSRCFVFDSRRRRRCRYTSNITKLSVHHGGIVPVQAIGDRLCYTVVSFARDDPSRDRGPASVQQVRSRS